MMNNAARRPPTARRCHAAWNMKHAPKLNLATHRWKMVFSNGERKPSDLGGVQSRLIAALFFSRAATGAINLRW